MSETESHPDVVIVGLGKTGMSCVRYFMKQGLTVAVADSRSEPPCLAQIRNEYPTIPVYLGDSNPDVLCHAGQVVLSPGVSPENKAIKSAIEKGIPVCGDVEIFCQQVQAPIIAITGSNGKSTVTTLVTEMARDAGIKVLAGANLGIPVLELLNEPIPDLYVLELSSFQLETTFSLNALASVVLNISPDHMDRYSSIEDYRLAKEKIYSGNGLMIMNMDDEAVNGMMEQAENRVTFSLISETADYCLRVMDGVSWLCRGNEKIIRERELGMKGKHNIANALAAIALLSVMNVPTRSLVNTLRCFTGLPHRCQKVATINEVDWYNDSKATNVGACVAAIKEFCHSRKIILIAGGDSKGADLSGLVSVVADHVKVVLLLGKDARKIADIIEPHVFCEFVSDMREAVHKANNLAMPGELVLLSPACASLDMYENYQQRGDEFMAAVHVLRDG